MRRRLWTKSCPHWRICLESTIGTRIRIRMTKAAEEKKKTQKAKKHWCFWECVLFLEPRGSFYDSCSTTVQVLTLARFGGWNCFLRFSHGRKLRRHEGQVPTCSNRIVFQVSIQLPIEKHRKIIEKDAFPVVGFLVDDFCWLSYWSRSYL